MQRRNFLLSVTSAFAAACLPALPAPAAAKAEKLEQNGISGAHLLRPPTDYSGSYWYKTDADEGWHQVAVTREGKRVLGYLDGIRVDDDTLCYDARFHLLVQMSDGLTGGSVDGCKALETFYAGLYARLGTTHLADIKVSGGIAAPPDFRTHEREPDPKWVVSRYTPAPAKAKTPSAIRYLSVPIRLS